MDGATSVPILAMHRYGKEEMISLFNKGKIERTPIPEGMDELPVYSSELLLPVSLTQPSEHETRLMVGSFQRRAIEPGSSSSATWNPRGIRPRNDVSTPSFRPWPDNESRSRFPRPRSEESNDTYWPPYNATKVPKFLDVGNAGRDEISAPKYEPPHARSRRQYEQLGSGATKNNEDWDSISLKPNLGCGPTFKSNRRNWREDGGAPHEVKSGDNLWGEPRIANDGYPKKSNSDGGLLKNSWGEETNSDSVNSRIDFIFDRNRGSTKVSEHSAREDDRLADTSVFAKPSTNFKEPIDSMLNERNRKRESTYLGARGGGDNRGTNSDDMAHKLVNEVLHDSELPPELLDAEMDAEEESEKNVARCLKNVLLNDQPTYGRSMYADLNHQRGLTHSNNTAVYMATKERSNSVSGESIPLLNQCLQQQQQFKPASLPTSAASTVYPSLLGNASGGGSTSWPPQIFSKALATENDVASLNDWYYKDPQGDIQGPFSGQEMLTWLNEGYFSLDLPITLNAMGPFISLGSILSEDVASRVELKRLRRIGVLDDHLLPIENNQPKPHLTSEMAASLTGLKSDLNMFSPTVIGSERGRSINPLMDHGKFPLDHVEHPNSVIGAPKLFPQRIPPELVAAMPSGHSSEIPNNPLYRQTLLPDSLGSLYASNPPASQPEVPSLFGLHSVQQPTPQNDAQQRLFNLRSLPKTEPHLFHRPNVPEPTPPLFSHRPIPDVPAPLFNRSLSLSEAPTAPSYPAELPTRFNQAPPSSSAPPADLISSLRHLNLEEAQRQPIVTQIPEQPKMMPPTQVPVTPALPQSYHQEMNQRVSFVAEDIQQVSAKSAWEQQFHAKPPTNEVYHVEPPPEVPSVVTPRVDDPRMMSVPPTQVVAPPVPETVRYSPAVEPVLVVETKPVAPEPVVQKDEIERPVFEEMTDNVWFSENTTEKIKQPEQSKKTTKKQEKSAVKKKGKELDNKKKGSSPKVVKDSSFDDEGIWGEPKPTKGKETKAESGKTTKKNAKIPEQMVIEEPPPLEIIKTKKEKKKVADVVRNMSQVYDEDQGWQEVKAKKDSKTTESSAKSPAQQKSSPTVEVKTEPVIEVARNAIAASVAPEQDDFTKWCYSSLAVFKPATGIDIPTFTTLLMETQSQGDVKSYVFDTLGTSTATQDFVNEFLLQRAKSLQKQKRAEIPRPVEEKPKPAPILRSAMTLPTRPAPIIHETPFLMPKPAPQRPKLPAPGPNWKMPAMPVTNTYRSPPPPVFAESFNMTETDYPKLESSSKGEGIVRGGLQPRYEEPASSNASASKKKKKNRMLKLDNSILGFQVTAASDRIVGEIENPPPAK